MNDSEASNTNSSAHNGEDTDALIDELIQSCTAEAKFTQREKEILAVFDEALELELEAALLQTTAAQRSPKPNTGNEGVMENGPEDSGNVDNGQTSGYARASRPSSNHDAAEEQENVNDEELQRMIKKAEQEATKARAEYMLRNKIIQNVVIAHPVLKAVHGGRDETFADRLLPLINDRDILSMLQTNLAEHLVHLSTITAETSRDVVLVNKENEKLVATLRELIKAERADVKSVEEALIAEQVEDGGEDSMDVDRIGGKTRDDDARTFNYAERARKVKQELDNVAHERRIYKGIARGLVVNSGIDWARDDQLRELVMDDEEVE